MILYRLLTARYLQIPATLLSVIMLISILQSDLVADDWKMAAVEMC